MFAFFHTLELESKLTLLVSALFFIPLITVSIYVSTSVSRQYREIYSARAASAAGLIASSPAVIEALSTPGDSKNRKADAALRRFLDEATAVMHVSYIIPSFPDGVPLYSAASAAGTEFIAEAFPDSERPPLPPPQPLNVREFRGGYLQAANWSDTPPPQPGASFSSEQAVAPVFDQAGRQIGSVTVGLVHDDVKNIYALFTHPLQKIMLMAMMAGLVCAIFLARSIKKILLGLEPEQIATLLQERSSMLEIMTEGVVAVNTKKRATLVNAEAERILNKAGLPGPFLNRPLYDETLRQNLRETMQSGIPLLDEEQSINGVAVLASYMPLIIDNRVVGAIAAFRDMSEVRHMAERITDINRYVDALRAQSHEFLNKLHVIMGLLNRGQTEMLSDYVAELVDNRTQESKNIHDSVKDPVIAGFLSSKHSNARELGATLFFSIEGSLPMLENSLRNGLITILGNLIDNALDAVSTTQEKKLSIHMATNEATLTLQVGDTGSGMDNTALNSVYEKNYSTKGPARGLGLWLVKKTVTQLRGDIGIHSSPGQGTLITVSLPLAKSVCS